MDANNWRPNPPVVEPNMDASDWRTQLQPDSRQRIVNKIMDTLKRHLPVSGQEGLNELKKIAGRFEEKIYTAATSQSDYLRKISLKMLSMESKSQNAIANTLQSNNAGSSNKPPDPGSAMQNQVHNQGQSLPIPLSANQSQAWQQLLSQNIQNNLSSAGGQGSSGLPSALPPVSGLSQAPIPSVVGQNANMQNMSGISQNSVGNSMGQGVPPNLFANSQRQMPGRQQVLPQQQQQSQNSQQFLYHQQIQQQLLKQKLQQGNLSHTLMQPQIQQQQQQSNLLQPNQLQSSQQSGMQTSSVMQANMMQSPPLPGLQQKQQSSVQQSTQPMMQQHPQSVLRPQQQPVGIHQQQTPMAQQSIMPPQQHQQLMGQPPNTANMQQSQLIGLQNNVGDMQQGLLGQQSNLPNLHQQQQQQLMAQQNLSSMHHQQLGTQSNVSGIQQQPQQQQQQLLLGTQSGNSSMQIKQHPVHMLQRPKVPLQQQTQQSAPNLLPNQGHQQQPQPPQQQMMSQIQSQPTQLQQQLGLQQQPNPLQRDMQQRLQASGQASGSLLQQQNVMDQKKQLYQSQRALTETSSTQTGQANEAYEASNASRQLVLTHYTELMNGIIDTEEDVKLLRESGIILNTLKSDAEVANLWNGMSKSIQLTSVPHIDKVIGGVNKYYNNQWKVEIWKNMKLYVFGSWKVLTLLATIVLLLLMGLQKFLLSL